MIDKIFIFIRKAFSKVESDRIYTKLDRVDERIDRIEVIQEAQNGKLNSIHEISLANLEAVEQKINRIGAQVADGYESAKEVTGVKFDAMQKSFEHLERLVLEVLKNR
jgi:transcriptional regulator NrdR family protein